ncbi:MAG: BrnA antitoxin family protein [Steroidobacteraceae bacterium]
MKRVTTLQKPKSFKAKSRDSDNPPWSEELLGPAVVKRGRGPQRTPTKVSTTIRLDADVLSYFRATGRGYQTQINDALRKVVKRGLTTRSSGRRSV